MCRPYWGKIQEKRYYPSCQDCGCRAPYSGDSVYYKQCKNCFTKTVVKQYVKNMYASTHEKN
jgi:hypothetical protein